MDAIGWIARTLKMQPRSFTFSGTKDRRAVTCQRVAVHKVRADRLASIGHSMRDVKLGNFCYEQNALKLGRLSGNKFTIVLRQVDADKETTDESCRSLKETGFISYYGM